MTKAKKQENRYDFANGNVPRHVAIIMDGNGRWAKSRNRPRVFGHHSGVDSVRKVVEAAAEAGVKILTLYAFSTENWSRPKQEVDTLMSLLSRSLKQELKKLQENNIQLRAIGDLSQLPAKVRQELEEVISSTANNDHMILNLALSYGSRKELVQAVKKISRLIASGELTESGIDEQLIQSQLYTHELPDVDFLIRTGGEQRISNFLLWQIAYAEIYFTATMWPDFKKEHFYEALSDFQRRERRYGKTSEQIHEKIQQNE